MKKKNSKHRFFDDFDEFDDYDEYEEDYDDVSTDESFYNYTAAKDFSDVSYDDFNKVIEVEDDDEDEYIDDDTTDDVEPVTIKRKSTTKSKDTDIINAQLLVLLNNFWLVFRIIGIGIAVILFFYYLIHGQIRELITYLFLLAGAFGFGFIFMFFVNKLMES